MGKDEEESGVECAFRLAQELTVGLVWLKWYFQGRSMDSCARLSIDVLELLQMYMNAYGITMIRGDGPERKGILFWRSGTRCTRCTYISIVGGRKLYQREG